MSQQTETFRGRKLRKKEVAKGFREEGEGGRRGAGKKKKANHEKARPEDPQTLRRKFARQKKEKKKVRREKTIALGPKSK